MHHSYIAFAIPMFLFFMGVEYWYSKRKGKNFFQFAESVANINVGIAERLMDVFTIVPFYYFFNFIYQHYALLTIEPTWYTWVLLFLATDLVWYFYHRFAHEINILWAAHIVHHQSEDFNYTASARITVFQASVRCLFWAVLPLIGFPPIMISTFLLIHGIYPFFIHTQTIGKLGFIEKFMVTPSHHRVHHSSNPQYLDKNYGDVLIIWDKIFGTFVEEKEQPVYGLTKPINSYSFLWQHFHYVLELAVAFKKAVGFKQKWKVIFGSPNNIDPNIRTALEKVFLRNKVATQPTKAHQHYIIAQTTITLVALFWLVYNYVALQIPTISFTTVLIIISVINTGAILEQQSWIFYLESMRFFIFLYWIWYAYPTFYTAFIILLLVVTIMYYFRPMERSYKKILYH
ncbi:sterol desaturase family protein [Ferruginibacter yonginensis]|uniref:Sterol desaturase family protein n=1 Tax=Ferruginibacter yonginensis TaxID=1310416 RepID=A0ABV8QUA6_9BACT